ncbi:uncharacterized protein B0I36DRAFT_366502 [Microdochium trichocladiopsis]|uniref:Uncharacterized protein n=1 Tax=Microdochium trichocladiopsis TaxID=1682393 RepID=A0A9P9BPI0_9PEZI|nr:uncharacterized protein B0I36DRAFT_366502 [Microdochium trichocladiopsis]KAH7024566.1 hypothetical protein B0I36DRAFT_366502 [Microdochium trichocladiopsis]
MATDLQTSPRLQTLSNLPQEIIENICRRLCEKCDHVADGLCELSNCHESADRRALASLCRTSRTVARVAQPHLFHVVRHITKVEELTRTLSEDARLAGLIRVFEQSRYVYFREMETKPSPLIGLLTQLDICDDRDPFPASGIIGSERIKYIFIQLVMIYATQLERLRLDINGDAWSGFDLDLLSAKLDVLKHASGAAEVLPLSRVRTIHLTTQWDYGMPFLCRAIQVLLRATGATIEQLVLHNIIAEYDTVGDCMRDVRLPGLRRLVLSESAFDRSSQSSLAFLLQICESAHNLEEFHFSAMAVFLGEMIDAHATASDFVDCLQPCRETLRALTLDLCSYSSQLQFEPCLPAGTLAGFSQLRELALEETSFCQRRRQQPDAAGLPAHTCLITMLPASIQRLVIRLWDGSHVWGDLRELARHAAMGEFPNLEDIRVLASAMDMEDGHNPPSPEDFLEEYTRASRMVQGAFASTGISLTVTHCDRNTTTSSEVDMPWLNWP